MTNQEECDVQSPAIHVSSKFNEEIKNNDFEQGVINVYKPHIMYELINKPQFTKGIWVVFIISISKLIELALGTGNAILVNSIYYKIFFLNQIFMVLISPLLIAQLTIATFPTIVDETGNNNGTMTNMTSTDFQADVPNG